VSEPLEFTRDPSTRRTVLAQPSFHPFLYTLLSLPTVSSRGTCGTPTNDSHLDRQYWPASKKDGPRNDVDTPATRKRSKAQRVTRTACANATAHFLLTYILAMLLAPSE